MTTDSRNPEEAHHRRVAKILGQARRETSVRDVIVFSCGRLWAVLLSLGAVLYVLASGKHADE